MTREILTDELFGQSVRELARQVVDSGFEPDILLGIARGGLVPAGALAYALDGKNLFTISVAISTGVDERLDVPVMLPPFLDARDLDAAEVLVVDDVADTGRTLEPVHEFCARLSPRPALRCSPRSRSRPSAPTTPGAGPTAGSTSPGQRGTGGPPRHPPGRLSPPPARPGAAQTTSEDWME